jgi:hypothetical protein
VRSIGAQSIARPAGGFFEEHRSRYLSIHHPLVMARIIAGSYMVRYPLGGMLSWSLQWLVGLRRLGHEVIFVEKSLYADSCYNPRKRESGDDCAYGLKTVIDLFRRHGLNSGWCYVDFAGNYHGMSRPGIEDCFRKADLFLDLGTHGAWLEEASSSGLRVLVDGEPGYTQIRMEKGCFGDRNRYDHYFSNGANIGTPHSTAPTAGRDWKPVFNPVVTDLFQPLPLPAGVCYSTVMNWQSHAPLDYQGKSYGQKNIEFAKFIDLPMKIPAAMEIAVSGSNVPMAEIQAAGWQVSDAQEVTISYDSYRDYIFASRGEFSVCKSIFVALHTGWFSDRSAAYLASGRPVVLQETGFSRHLPTGEGLFAVRDIQQAAAAIAEIEGDYPRHAAKAREIACDCLDSGVILGKFLNEIGI